MPRYVCIWFRYLKADWLSCRRPGLKDQPFVLTTPERGRLIITTVNSYAHDIGIFPGFALADARAIYPGLIAEDDQPGWAEQVLNKIAIYCIRYTPLTAINLPDGIILETTGCDHLWGGEKSYITEIHNRLSSFGYHVHIAMADTIGVAWACAHFGENMQIVEPGNQSDAILSLPAEAVRPEKHTLEKLNKLGLRTIGKFISMPRKALKRRFGDQLLLRIDQALGIEKENIEPFIPPEPYQERLPCLEPIVTAQGIEIALKQLLLTLCKKLQKEEKGLRKLVFTCLRIDHQILHLEINTNHPSHNPEHLFNLCKEKISELEPDLGIELFMLEAPVVEELVSKQENLWREECGLEDIRFSELMDRIAEKIGVEQIQRFLPDEHYWPERSVKKAQTFRDPVSTTWNVTKPRPVFLLSDPAPIIVTAPVPDYPPILFRYRNQLHIIKKADGPERIENEWWLEDGEHRDYYAVEDETGCRYWVFREGHYSADHNTQWFLHGFFA